MIVRSIILKEKKENLFKNQVNKLLFSGIPRCYSLNAESNLVYKI